ncbi:cation:proton antiporter [Aeromicrobium sp. UC242_57]|uniref:cation:proton antiporter domain-containing protein n=1 Tax=Aeromicrobium sp. UC242_57 TaxID=3374624 RepID=UPI00378C8858
MDLTIFAVLALAVIVASSVLAPKVGVASPLVLIAAGFLLALVPGVPRIEPEPELILAGVLPPLLYAASVNMPAMDFRRDLKSIGWLSIVVVISSALAIGWIVELVVPGSASPRESRWAPSSARPMPWRPRSSSGRASRPG